MRNKQRPFAFADIWDEWKDPSFNESRRGFAIITTAPNELMQKIDHPRSPVILHPGQWRKWLNPRNHLNDILPMLKPYPAAKMNAYPVSNRLKNPRENDIDLLKPLGDPVLEEKTIELGKRHEGFYKWEIRVKNRMKP